MKSAGAMAAPALRRHPENRASDAALAVARGLLVRLERQVGRLQVQLHAGLEALAHARLRVERLRRAVVLVALRHGVLAVRALVVELVLAEVGAVGGLHLVAL